MPPICALRTSPCAHPSRPTSAPGGRRHHLRCSRPRPAGLARQGASRLPAGRAWQRPAATCSAAPPTAQDRPRGHIHLAGDGNNNKMDSFDGGVRDREKVAGSPKRRDSPVIDGMRMRPTPGPGWARGQIAVRQDGHGSRGGGGNKRVTLIQNAAMACVESEAKRMRQNTDKNRRKSCKGQKGKNPKRRVPSSTRSPLGPCATRGRSTTALRAPGAYTGSI